MRSFESPSPRGEKPEITENTPPVVPMGQAADAQDATRKDAAGQGSAGPAASVGQVGGHTYRRRPTPSQATGDVPPEGSRVYYSKKKNGKGGAVARQSRFTSKQMRLNIMLGALILVLIVSLVLAALLPGCQQVPVASSSNLADGSSLCSSVPVASYDKDELAIPEGEYAGTMLAETEDAGDEYVEETLFIGDSNTERMIQYNSTTGVSMKNGIGIESMGIGSVTGLKCVRFSGYNDMTIPQAVQVMQPKRIVIMFGTNNIGMYADSFIDQYEYALETIEEYWPYADIIIGSILPISQNCTYGSLSQKAIDEFNLALVEMAKEKEYKFLNWSESIKDARTGYAKTGMMISDGVHITTAGLEKLFEYFRTHSHITEDTRPKPLKAVPNRLPTPEGLFPKPESSSSSSDSDSDISKSKSGSGSSSSSSSQVVSSVPETPSSQAPPVSITVSVAGGEGGTASGGQAAGAPGTTVTLTGVSYAAATGYEFSGWTAGTYDAAAQTLKVTIPDTQSGNLVVYATFTAVAAESPAEGAAESTPGGG